MFIKHSYLGLLFVFYKLRILLTLVTFLLLRKDILTNKTYEQKHLMEG